MTMTENVYNTYFELLSDYYVNVWKSNKCKSTLAKLHVTNQISDSEYIAYIPRMQAKLEILASLLNRSYEEDLKENLANLL